MRCEESLVGYEYINWTLLYWTLFIKIKLNLIKLSVSDGSSGLGLSAGLEQLDTLGSTTLAEYIEATLQECMLASFITITVVNTVH